MSNHMRSIEDLERHAVKWWPNSLKKIVAQESPIHILLDSHEVFLSILKASKEDANSLFSIIYSSNISLNLFLKHLAIFTDFGGEQISRLGREFNSLFKKNKKHYFKYLLNGKLHTYYFQGLPSKSLGNVTLLLDKKRILKKPSVNSQKLICDVIAILLFAGLSTNSNTSKILQKCNAGVFLGKGKKLEAYIRKLYLHLSRVTSGSTSNNLGQILEKYVASYLQKKLGPNFSVKKEKVLCLDKKIPFDIVITRGKKIIGIEISFQVTTNSTIERKSAQAKQRRLLMKKNGHKIAYIIDGAGNFQRKNAITQICNNSDCTVAFSNSELNILVTFIKEELA